MPIDLTDKVFLLGPTDDMGNAAIKTVSHPAMGAPGFNIETYLADNYDLHELTADVWCQWVINARKVQYTYRVESLGTEEGSVPVDNLTDYGEHTRETELYTPSVPFPVTFTSGVTEEGVAFIEPYHYPTFAKFDPENPEDYSTVQTSWTLLRNGKFYHATLKEYLLPHETVEYVFNDTVWKHIYSFTNSAYAYYRVTTQLEITDTYF